MAQKTMPKKPTKAEEKPTKAEETNRRMMGETPTFEERRRLEQAAYRLSAAYDCPKGGRVNVIVVNAALAELQRVLDHITARVASWTAEETMTLASIIDDMMRLPLLAFVDAYDAWFEAGHEPSGLLFDAMVSARGVPRMPQKKEKRE